MDNMSEQKKGVHHAIVISYYSVSKDEYIPIEDMAHEHLVNVIYKSVRDPYFNANFEVKVSTGVGQHVRDYATLKLDGSPNFSDNVVSSVT